MRTISRKANRIQTFNRPAPPVTSPRSEASPGEKEAGVRGRGLLSMQQMQLLLRRAFLGLIVFSGLAIIPFSPAAGEPTPDPTPAATPPEVAATETVKPSAAVENSVVKVFSSVRYPDLYKPWSKQAPSEFTGSGVVIEGKRILTNAHVVLYASQVQVQANQSGDKLAATVEAIAPGIDLAVLKLDDESFFDTHPPLAQAKILPEVRTLSWPTATPREATAFRSPGGLCRALSSPPTTFRYT